MFSLKNNQTLPTIYLLLITLAAVIICSTRFEFSYVGLISYLFFLSILSLLIFLTGRIKLSLSITSTLIVIIQLLNQIKVHYYKERLFFPDISIAFDPSNFSTLLHYPLAALSLIGLALLFIFNFFLYLKQPKIKFIFRVLSLLTMCGLILSITLVSRNQSNIEDWQASLPKGKGTIVNIFISAQQMHYQAPQYSESSDYFLSKNEFSYQPNSSENIKPDIVVMLQESTVNPNIYHLAEVDLPKFEMFTPNKVTKANSLLRVQTFGGGTWLSEFSLLTGLDTDDFKFRKNSVFYTVAPHIKNSIFRELKNNGYYTVVLTPMAKQNYNAGPTYKNLGIDLIIQPQELGYPAELDDNLWKIPTEAMLGYVKKILEQHADKPVFIFVLTMNEHGPYDTSHADNYKIEQSISDRNIAGALSHYISKINLLNDATQNFKHFVNVRDKPTIFLYFGDHQPNIGWNSTYNTEQLSPDYLTQFYLEDNFSAVPVKNIGKITDISFLSGLLLETANLNVSPFFKANMSMRNLCQGRLSDCPDDKLVNSYKHYIYQELEASGK